MPIMTIFSSNLQSLCCLFYSTVLISSGLEAVCDVIADILQSFEREVMWLMMTVLLLLSSVYLWWHSERKQTVIVLLGKDTVNSGPWWTGTAEDTYFLFPFKIELRAYSWDFALCNFYQLHLLKKTSIHVPPSCPFMFVSPIELAIKKKDSDHPLDNVGL